VEEKVFSPALSFGGRMEIKKCDAENEKWQVFFGKIGVIYNRCTLIINKEHFSSKTFLAKDSTQYIKLSLGTHEISQPSQHFYLSQVFLCLLFMGC